MSEQIGSDRFANLDFSEKQLIYNGFLALVKSNSGDGFCNHDQGHSAYVVGLHGDFDFEMWGDSPEHNSLFGMMNELSIALSFSEVDRSAETSEYVFCWADFCRLAYDAYKGRNVGD